MIVKNNVPIYSICWLRHAKGGMIETYYEPENRSELAELCRKLYSEGKKFELIGYTSNTYFMPTCNIGIVVSTRKVRNYIVNKDYVEVDCGVSVMQLSRKMVSDGVKGFEGLVDLPGTVAASVYGNASCYDCSINSVLLSFELLKPSGEIVVMKPEDLRLDYRTSALKRGEWGGNSFCQTKEGKG